MAPLVVVLVSFRAEASVALRTHIGQLAVMDSSVDFQIVLFSESFATRGNTASERLCALVGMHVSFQADHSIEVLIASSELARVHSLSLIYVLFDFFTAAMFCGCLLGSIYHFLHNHRR